MFGYTLVHAPAKFQLLVYTSLGVLASSVNDHLPPDGKIAGAISILQLLTDCSISDVYVEKLPQCVRECITGLEVVIDIRPISSLITGIKSLPNMKILIVDCFMSIRDDDFMLFRALADLSNLEKLEFLNLSIITLKCVQELSITIAKSYALRNISLRFHCHEADRDQEDEGLEDIVLKLGLCKLVEAALSCSTVEELVTDIPLTAFNATVVADMRKMTFAIDWDDFPLTVAQDSLCCIADLCSRMPALEELVMDFSHLLTSPKLIFPPFIALLNNALYSNPFNITLTGSASDSTAKSTGLLSSALCKDSKIARLHLRRSKSFPDLTLSHVSLPLQHAHSCPDLSGIHCMHPQLHRILMKDYIIFAGESVPEFIHPESSSSREDEELLSSSEGEELSSSLEDEVSLISEDESGSFDYEETMEY